MFALTLTAMSVVLSPTLEIRRSVGTEAAARALRRTRPAMCDVSVTGDSVTGDAFESCMGMKVSELKAELDLRKVSYDGMFEKEEFARCLSEARRSGRADPDILDAFNKQSAEQAWAATDVLVDEATGEAEGPGMGSVTSSDGGLPGGLSPEAMSSLSSNPEAMAILRNPKMQAVMKQVMEGGPEAAGAFMDDAEVRKMLEEFQGLAGGK